jgi:dUTP pyrophosphatase
MEEAVRVSIRYLKHHEGLLPIARQTPGASGFDVQAACADRLVVAPGAAVIVPAGFELAVPDGYEAQVRPRSGLAARCGIGVLNSPGTIDSDYRGEVCVILHNFGDEEFVVRRGDRIAQLVFSRVPRVELVERDSLDETGRGPGGFGHTG